MDVHVQWHNAYHSLCQKAAYHLPKTTFNSAVYLRSFDNPKSTETLCWNYIITSAIVHFSMQSLVSKWHWKISEGLGRWENGIPLDNYKNWWSLLLCLFSIHGAIFLFLVLWNTAKLYKCCVQAEGVFTSVCSMISSVVCFCLVQCVEGESDMETFCTPALWWLWERRLFYSIYQKPVFVKFRWVSHPL